MKPKFYNTIIVPVLAANAAFLAITTPGEKPTNFVSRLISLKFPDGRAVFKTISIEQVCDKCKRLGLGASCTHKIGEIPPWQDESRISGSIKEILKNDPETLMRETKGMQTSSTISEAFSMEQIKAWRGHVYPGGFSNPYVYVAVDPNAGGLSEVAVVSATFYPGSEMVVRKSFFFYSKRGAQDSMN